MSKRCLSSPIDRDDLATVALDLLAAGRECIPTGAEERGALTLGLPAPRIQQVRVDRVSGVGHLAGAIGAPDRAEQCLPGTAGRRRLAVRDQRRPVHSARA